MSTFDSRLLTRVAASSLTVVGYRNQAPGFDPTSGEGARRAGGRFNPPHSFPVVYLCTTHPCVKAELTRQAERQRIAMADLLPREVWEVRVALEKVLDLTDTTVLGELGLAPDALVRDSHELTREIGEAAYEQGFQAIRSPSATGVDDVLAVFVEKLGIAVVDVALIAEWADVDDFA